MKRFGAVIQNETMDLFSDKNTNLLPYDGMVNYFGRIMSVDTANNYLDILLKNITWKHDEAFIFGRHIFTRRKVAWYGDTDFEYSYSNTQKRALPWTRELIDLKSLTEKISGQSFNSCLMNLYHDGSEGVSWHSDGEKDLKKDGAIGSLSFGAERKFIFKHKQNKTNVELFLEHGSLMVMKGITQMHWLHRLPPASRITRPRVNLTFRTIVQ
jgi:alkylated DNA repair dioxygenase AlkB